MDDSDKRDDIIAKIIELADGNLDYFDIDQPTECLIKLLEKLRGGAMNLTTGKRHENGSVPKIEEKKEPNSKIKERMINEIIRMAQHLNRKIDPTILRELDFKTLEKEFNGLQNNMVSSPIKKIPETKERCPSNYNDKDKHQKENIIQILVEEYGMYDIDKLNNMDIQSLKQLLQEQHIEQEEEDDYLPPSHMPSQMQPFPMPSYMAPFHMPFPMPSYMAPFHMPFPGQHNNVQAALDASLDTEIKDKKQKELEKEIEGKALSCFADEKWIKADKIATILGCNKQMKKLKIKVKGTTDCNICCTSQNTFYSSKCGHEMCLDCWTHTVNAVPSKAHNNTCAVCDNSDIDNTHWLKICTTCKRANAKRKWELVKCPVCQANVI
jgi:hypothetical protein